MIPGRVTVIPRAPRRFRVTKTCHRADTPWHLRLEGYRYPLGAFPTAAAAHDYAEKLRGLHGARAGVTA